MHGWGDACYVIVCMAGEMLAMSYSVHGWGDACYVIVCMAGEMLAMS